MENIGGSNGRLGNIGDSDLFWVGFGMFKIGDFSKLGQVSTRMLRHYDKLGLLVPNHIDEWTGYRYYTVEQLAQLHRIIALKDLGLSLQQISDLMQGDEKISIEQLRGMLVLKQAEVEQELLASQSRLDNISARLQQIEDQERPFSYEVIIKSVPAQMIASIRQTIPHLSEMHFYCESLYEQLYQGLAKHNIQPQSPEIAMYHQEEYSEEDVDIEMSVAVDLSYDDHEPIENNIHFRQLPAQEQVAALIHKGPFNHAPQAALALLTWVGTHDYAPVPPLRELRLSGRAHQAGALQTEPVLEFQLPIQKLLAE
jgi:DNA-binding transcriptional MerR regulator